MEKFRVPRPVSFWIPLRNMGPFCQLSEAVWGPVLHTADISSLGSKCSSRALQETEVKLLHDRSSQFHLGVLLFPLPLHPGPSYRPGCTSVLLCLCWLGLLTLRKCYSVSSRWDGWRVGGAWGSLALSPSCGIYVLTSLRPRLLKPKNFSSAFCYDSLLAMNPVMLKWGKSKGF